MQETRKEKWVFIVNPVAGNHFGITMITDLEKKIKEFNIDGQIVQTEAKGHASTLSKSFADKGFSHIIAVGGDGTLNEVARPLIGNKEVITGIIPAGTGNDYSQIPGFPGRFSDGDWKVFFRKEVIPQDVGTVNDSIFLNGLGIGFDAEVAAQNYSDGGKVKKGGGDKYIWHIIKTLLFFREKRMQVINEGKKHETDCFINTISIGRRFAGSFFLTPRAIANDGLLDVCSIKKLNLYHRFRLLLKVPSGKHIFDPKVSYFQTSSIDLEFPEEVPYHVDGELFFAKDFKVRIIPEGLRVIYHKTGPHFFRNA